MWTVGFIDDDKSYVEGYQVRLKRKDINLIFAENCNTKEDILNWILFNQLKCVLIDYKLTQGYNFMGTDLVAYINSELPDLPCIVLTNYCEEGISNNLVVKNMFIDRSVMDKLLNNTDFEEFIGTIKQSIEVFNNRLELRFEEYKNLKSKKDENIINAHEEERFINLYKLLRAYNEVDDIPADLLRSDTTKKMDEILSALNKITQKTE